MQKYLVNSRSPIKIEDSKQINMNKNTNPKKGTKEYDLLPKKFKLPEKYNG